jgi:hypothetical protein
MPNWCESILVIKGEENLLKAFAMFAKTGKTKKELMLLDAQRFIPRPESLDITSGTSTDHGIAVIQAEEHGNWKEIDRMLTFEWAKGWTRKKMITHLKKKNANGMKEGRMALDNIKKYGCPTWYDWNCKNWGTKWNFRDVTVSRPDFHEGELGYTFSTAWSPPLPVIAKMSEMFPDLEFTIEYREEGLFYEGKLVIKNNKVISHEEGECQDQK